MVTPPQRTYRAVVIRCYVSAINRGHTGLPGAAKEYEERNIKEENEYREMFVIDVRRYVRSQLHRSIQFTVSHATPRF
jgi:hypothetical protein